MFKPWWNVALFLVLAVIACSPVRTRADSKSDKGDDANGHKEAARDSSKDTKESATEPVKKLTVNEFDKKRSEKGAVVLDVRTPEEYAAGHVPGAVNLNLQDKNFKEKMQKLDKSKTYLVHCARGGRSARATAEMSDLGFKNLFDFSGGMTAWKKAGKPVDKGGPETKPSEKVKKGK